MNLDTSMLNWLWTNNFKKVSKTVLLILIICLLIAIPVNGYITSMQSGGTLYLNQTISTDYFAQCGAWSFMPANYPTVWGVFAHVRWASGQPGQGNGGNTVTDFWLPSGYASSIPNYTYTGGLNNDSYVWVQTACMNNPPYDDWFGWKYYNVSNTIYNPIPPSTNITYTFKDNANNALLENVYVDQWNQAHDTSQEGYTDSNGQITFQGSPVENLQMNAFKGTYAILQQTVIPTNGNYNLTVYMTKAVIGSPLTINLSITVRDSYGWYLNLSNVLVTLKDDIAHTSERSAYTNANGIAIFQGVPNTAYIEGTLSKAGYVTRTWSVGGQPLGDWFTTLYMSNYNQVTGVPTPVPLTPINTPVSYDTWTLGANPTAINQGGSSLLLAQCSNVSKQESTGGLRQVLFYGKSNLGTAQFSLVGIYNWNASTSNWDFRANNNAPWDYTAHIPRELEVFPSTSGIWTYQVVTTGTPDYTSYGTAETTLTVQGEGSQGNLIMNVFALDGNNGAHLSNVELTLTSLSSGTSQIYTVSYDRNVNLPRGIQYTLKGHKDGYEDNTITFTVPVDLAIKEGSYGAIANVPLMQIGTTSAGNTTVTVHVTDGETYFPIGNVNIQITGSGLNIPPKFTGQGGEAVSFSVPQNHDFKATASKDGYCSVADSRNTSTLTYTYVALEMKYGACQGVTPTHTPIPNSTPVSITPTPIGGYGQLNGSAVVCNRTATFDFTNFVGSMKNQLACLGLNDLLTQNLALACLIIFGFGIIASKYAKAIGFALGAILGGAISMALGLIPFWLIALIIILFVFIAILLFGKNV